MFRIILILVSILIGVIANKLINLAYMKSVKPKYDYLQSIGFIANTYNNEICFVKELVVLTKYQIDSMSLFELKEKYK